eukprot:TRINITY_DN25890_c0_g2_i1.p1 TRINITY_DN25890_c0_g2~~TRINITY_DN25890_c0_g2_i1.p1  ORF type:complete len:1165 (-),score=239.14 TRINITY_DN25890_c0_g2_i1:263-3757(-)
MHPQRPENPELSALSIEAVYQQPSATAGTGTSERPRSAGDVQLTGDAQLRRELCRSINSAVRACLFDQIDREQHVTSEQDGGTGNSRNAAAAARTLSPDAADTSAARQDSERRPSQGSIMSVPQHPLIQRDAGTGGRDGDSVDLPTFMAQLQSLLSEDISQQLSLLRADICGTVGSLREDVCSAVVASVQQEFREQRTITAFSELSSRARSPEVTVARRGSRCMSEVSLPPLQDASAEPAAVGGRVSLIVPGKAAPGGVILPSSQIAPSPSQRRRSAAMDGAAPGSLWHLMAGGEEKEAQRKLREFVDEPSEPCARSHSRRGTANSEDYKAVARMAVLGRQESDISLRQESEAAGRSGRQGQRVSLLSGSASTSPSIRTIISEPLQKRPMSASAIEEERRGADKKPGGSPAHRMSITIVPPTPSASAATFQLPAEPASTAPPGVLPEEDHEKTHSRRESFNSHSTDGGRSLIELLSGPLGVVPDAAVQQYEGRRISKGSVPSQKTASRISEEDEDSTVEEATTALAKAQGSKKVAEMAAAWHREESSMANRLGHSVRRLSVSVHEQALVLDAEAEARCPLIHRCVSLSTKSIAELRRLIILFVSWSYFDYVMAMLIVLNAITIGAQSDWHVRNPGQETPNVFNISEEVFAMVFTAELGLRLLAFGTWFFYMPEWKWNIFDITVVCLQLSEEILALFTGSAREEKVGNLNFIRVLRVLRLARIIRVFRLLRYLQELRAMLLSIVSSLRSLCWTICLLLFLIYILSVYVTQLIADTSVARPNILDPEISELPRYFGSLPACVLSLFQAMTGGVDWNDLNDPLATLVSPHLTIVLCAYIAFAVFAMMNVVTGVFVESALATAKEDRESEVRAQVRRLFRMSDTDDDGKITWEEFTYQLTMPGMDKYFSALDIDIGEARGLFLLLDTDESGEVDMEEFVLGCLRLRGPAKAIDLATLMYFSKRSLVWSVERQESLSDRQERGFEVMMTMLEDLSRGLTDLMVKTNSSGQSGCHSNANAANTLNPGNKPHIHLSKLNNQRKLFSQEKEFSRSGPSICSSWAELKAAAEKEAQHVLVALGQGEPVSRPDRRTSLSLTQASGCSTPGGGGASGLEAGRGRDRTPKDSGNAGGSSARTDGEDGSPQRGRSMSASSTRSGLQSALSSPTRRST